MLRSLASASLLVAVLAVGAAGLAPPSQAQEILATNRVDIVDVQQRLADLGWYRGAVDGIAGPATLAAANAFRRAAGISTAPLLDKELQLQLHFVNPELRRGATQTVRVDPQVRRAQELLKLLGYYRTGVDGIEGPRTRAAVGDFRRERGLGGGERVDAALLDQLDRELQRRGAS